MKIGEIAESPWPHPIILILKSSLSRGNGLQQWEKGSFMGFHCWWSSDQDYWSIRAAGSLDFVEDI